MYDIVNTLIKMSSKEPIKQFGPLLYKCNPRDDRYVKYYVPYAVGTVIMVATAQFMSKELFVNIIVTSAIILWSLSLFAYMLPFSYSFANDHKRVPISVFSPHTLARLSKSEVFVPTILYVVAMTCFICGLTLLAIVCKTYQQQLQVGDSLKLVCGTWFTIIGLMLILIHQTVTVETKTNKEMHMYHLVFQTDVAHFFQKILELDSEAAFGTNEDLTEAKLMLVNILASGVEPVNRDQLLEQLHNRLLYFVPNYVAADPKRNAVSATVPESAKQLFKWIAAAQISTAPEWEFDPDLVSLRTWFTEYAKKKDYKCQAKQSVSNEDD